MTPLTANDILHAKNLVGGELELIENGNIYCGPLREIKEDRGSIYFSVNWCAKNTGKGWKVHKPIQCQILTEIFQPELSPRGNIHFLIPYIGKATIYPVGVKRLDPKQVEGLILSS